jgi:TPP-dependent pyruvate/acetoin dehydrogenase alpha subunit
MHCRDPIERVRKLILSLDIGVEAADLKKIEKVIKKEIDDVVEQCKADPLPESDKLTQNIYKDMLRDSFRGVDRLSKFMA